MADVLDFAEPVSAPERGGVLDFADPVEGPETPQGGDQGGGWLSKFFPNAARALQGRQPPQDGAAPAKVSPWQAIGQVGATGLMGVPAAAGAQSPEVAGTALGGAADLSTLEQRVWGKLFGTSDFGDPAGGVLKETRADVARTLDGHIQKLMDSDLPDYLKKAAITGLRGENVLADVILNTVESPVTSALTLGAGPTAKAAAKAGSLEELGGEILQSAVKPSKSIMRKRNAPDFMEPLRKGQVPVFGGLKKVSENVREDLVKTAAARDALISKSQLQVNIPGAISSTKKEIINRLRTGHGITRADADKAMQYADDALATAAERKSFNNGFVSGEDAVSLRKTADTKGKFSALPGKDPAEAIFNEVYRNEIEKQISARMQQKNVAARIGPDGAARYEGLKKDLAKLVPLDRALADRVLTESNNYKIGLTDNIAIAGAGLKAAPVILVNRLLKTPGGAAILYKIGRATPKGPVQKFILEAAGSGKVPAAAAKALNAIVNEQDDARRQELIDQLEK